MECDQLAVFSQSETDNTAQACQQYDSALSLRPASFTALYNQGVALSDLARAARHTNPSAAYTALSAASHKYARALSASPGNIQALNNWGLVMQVSTLAQCDI
jgi:Tfp pilus assembly protein PilF